MLSLDFRLLSTLLLFRPFRLFRELLLFFRLLGRPLGSCPSVLAARRSSSAKRRGQHDPRRTMRTLPCDSTAVRPRRLRNCFSRISSARATLTVPPQRNLRTADIQQNRYSGSDSGVLHVKSWTRADTLPLLHWFLASESNGWGMTASSPAAARRHHCGTFISIG